MVSQNLIKNGSKREDIRGSINPIPVSKCLFGAHKPDSANEAKDIPLTKESEVLKGSSDLGDLIVPGDPSKSLFYRVMVKDEKIRGRAKIMPPTESTRHAAVTDAELQIVAAWISGVAALPQAKPIEPKENDCRIVPDPNAPVPGPIVVAPVVIEFPDTVVVPINPIAELFIVV